MKIKLELDEKKIALIRNIVFKLDPQTGSFSCDKVNPYGIGRLYDDMALILGYYKDFIIGTECDADGKRYPEEIVKIMDENHKWVMDNMDKIMDIVFYLFNPPIGSYSRKDYLREWKSGK